MRPPYVPAAQAVQLDAPVATEAYLPAAHAEQTAEVVATVVVL